MNHQLFHLINAGAGRWPAVDHVLRFAADYLVYLVFSAGGAIVVYALTRGWFRRIAAFGGALALAYVLAELLHHLRPLHSHTPELPAHATAAFAVAFAVLVFFDRPAGIMLTAAATLIGFAQVWTGAHYPDDIITAAVIAALSAFSAYVIGRGPYPEPALP